MDILNFKSLAKNIKFENNEMWVELLDGRTLGVPLSYFPRLANATDSQLKNYIISGGGIGIHWEELDEDISVRGLLIGAFDLNSESKEAA